MIPLLVESPINSTWKYNTPLISNTSPVLQTGFNLLVLFLGHQISKFGGPGQFLVAQQISSIFTPIYVGNVLFSSYQVMNIKRSF